MLPCDFRTQHGSECPVCVGHLNLHTGFPAFFHCFSQLLQQYLFILCLFQSEIIYLGRVKRNFSVFSGIWIIKDCPQIDLRGPGVFRIFLHFQQVRASHHLIQCTDTQLCHILPQFFCDKPHKINHILRFSLKPFSKLRILGSHSHRACIQVADTHHNTSHSDQGCCCKPKFFSAQQRSHCHITSAH